MDRDNVVCYLNKNKHKKVPAALKKQVYAVVGADTRRKKEKLNWLIEEKNVLRFLTTTDENGKAVKRFYVNPILSLASEISINCYHVFEDVLKAYYE